ncbi:MAG: hypothetical protein Q7R41_19170, partial [Phycisphaerales bacterium]|nr:hypothetical protein [Phycisphaerales bacterium]
MGYNVFDSVGSTVSVAIPLDSILIVGERTEVDSALRAGRDPQFRLVTNAKTGFTVGRLPASVEQPLRAAVRLSSPDDRLNGASSAAAELLRIFGFGPIASVLGVITAAENLSVTLHHRDGQWPVEIAAT